MNPIIFQHLSELHLLLGRLRGCTAGLTALYEHEIGTLPPELSAVLLNSMGDSEFLLREVVRILSEEAQKASKES